MTSPTPPQPEEFVFGTSTIQVLRSAILVMLFGLVGVFLIARLVDRTGTPLHALAELLGLNAATAFVIGAVVVAIATGFGTWRALCGRTQFRASAAGLAVSDVLGTYLLAWDNVREMEALYQRDLGIRVCNREALVATHSGTPLQRQRLRDGQGYVGWDLTYLRHELGLPAATVVERLQSYRDRFG